MCLVWCVRGEELLWLLWDVGFVTGIKPQTAVWGAEKWFCRKRCANQLVHLRSKRRGWSRPGQGGVQGALWEAVLPCSGHLCIYSQVPSGGPALPPTPGQHSRPALWKRRKWSREEPGQAGTSVFVSRRICLWWWPSEQNSPCFTFAFQTSQKHIFESMPAFNQPGKGTMGKAVLT